MANRDEPFFGQIAVNKDFITLEQLDECLRIQKRMYPPHRIGQILIEQKYLTEKQLEDILAIQKKQATKEELMASIDDATLEKNVLLRGFASQKHVREAKRLQEAMKQKGKEMSLAEVMLAKHFITITQLKRLCHEPDKNKEEVFPEVEGYEILRKIRKGGMGTVYKSRQISMDRVIALKILAPELADDKTYVERFFIEAKAVAKLNHEHIVAGIECGESGGYYFFVMEYINGETILEIMRREKVLTVPFALSVTYQVTKALEHAAKHKIIHRDIKPGNIMINHHGVIKLCDLGFAKTSNIDLLTKEGTTLGTPYYMSPEQCRGLQDIDSRSDIYSLGATLYHMLVGKVPFSGKTASEILKKHLLEELVIPQERRAVLGEHVCHLIEKMMAKNRDERYLTPTDVLDELEPLMARFEAPKILILHHTGCVQVHDLALFLAEGAYVEGIKVELVSGEDVTAEQLTQAGAIVIGSLANSSEIPPDIKSALSIMSRFSNDMRGKLGAAFVAHDPRSKGDEGRDQLAKIFNALLSMELFVKGSFDNAYIGKVHVEDPEGEGAEKYRALGHDIATTLLNIAAGIKTMRNDFKVTVR